MTSEKNLYNDQLEGNAEAVDGMFESLMIDYTLSQLHSLAEAAKISINIFDKFKVSGVAVPDGIAYARAAASFFDDLGDYKMKLENGESEGSLKAEKAQICANIMGVFGTLTGEIKILEPLSAPLTYGADCLHAGAEIIQNRIELLDEYDKILDDALGWDDVDSHSSGLIVADEEKKYYSELLSEVRDLRNQLKEACVYDDSLESLISELDSILSQFDNKTNEIINKVEEKSGYRASNLSDLANHATSEKNNSNGGDWTDTTTDETSDDANDRYGDSGKTPAPRDPLIIDLGKKGIELTNVENGVHFDIDKNGFAEKQPGPMERTVSLYLIAMAMDSLMTAANYSATKLL